MVLFYHLTSEDSRYYLLSNLLSLSWVLLINGKWFKQTHCGSCSMNINTGMLYDLTSEKSDTECFLIYRVKVGYFSSLRKVV